MAVYPGVAGFPSENNPPPRASAAKRGSTSHPQEKPAKRTRKAISIPATAPTAGAGPPTTRCDNPAAIGSQRSIVPPTYQAVDRSKATPVNQMTSAADCWAFVVGTNLVSEPETELLRVELNAIATKRAEQAHQHALSRPQEGSQLLCIECW